MPEKNSASPVFVDLAQLEPVIKEARKWSKTYREVSGKNPTALADIAEYEAAKRLGLSLTVGGTSGYNAQKETGKGKTDFIVVKAKTTKSEKPTESIGKFAFSSSWNTAALVIMDPHFQVTSIYVAPKSKIQEVVKKAEEKAAREGSKTVEPLTLGIFKELAGKPAWVPKPAKKD